MKRFAVSQPLSNTHTTATATACRCAQLFILLSRHTSTRSLDSIYSLSPSTQFSHHPCPLHQLNAKQPQRMRAAKGSDLNVCGHPKKDKRKQRASSNRNEVKGQRRCNAIIRCGFGCPKTGDALRKKNYKTANERGAEQHILNSTGRGSNTCRDNCCDLYQITLLIFSFFRFAWRIRLQAVSHLARTMLWHSNPAATGPRQ